jgi:hypothetical protein
MVEYLALNQRWLGVRYNEFALFLENEEYRPCDGCKIEI